MFSRGSAPRRSRVTSSPSMPSTVELKSERARTAIEDHGRYIVKLRLHMGRSGRTDAPRTVCARRGDRKLRSIKQRAGDGMVRGAKRNGVETGAYEIGNGAASLPRQHQRQWSRPEGVDQFPRSVVDGGVALSLRQPEHMHDQRIEAGALLGGKHLGNRRGVERIGPEPVHRLGGKGHDLAPRQGFRGAADGLFRGGEDRHGERARPCSICLFIPFRVLALAGQATRPPV